MWRWNNLSYAHLMNEALRAMAFGEAVLVIAALINFAGYGTLVSNVGLILVSNVVMLAVLSRRFDGEDRKYVYRGWAVLNVSGVLLAVAALPVILL